MPTKLRPRIAGTRGSPLALIQTQLALDALQQSHPERPVVAQIHKLDALGDQTQTGETQRSQLAGTGVFVKELEEALLAGTIDLAVHSLKDLPAELPPGLKIAAVLPREDGRDVR